MQHRPECFSQRGRVLFSRRDDIVEEDMKQPHINSIIRAVEPGSYLGRTCMNLSYAICRTTQPSVNDGTDLARSDDL